MPVLNRNAFDTDCGYQRWWKASQAFSPNTVLIRPNLILFWLLLPPLLLHLLLQFLLCQYRLCQFLLSQFLLSQFLLYQYPPRLRHRLLHLHLLRLLLPRLPIFYRHFFRHQRIRRWISPHPQALLPLSLQPSRLFLQDRAISNLHLLYQDRLSDKLLLPHLTTTYCAL